MVLANTTADSSNYLYNGEVPPNRDVSASLEFVKQMALFGIVRKSLTVVSKVSSVLFKSQYVRDSPSSCSTIKIFYLSPIILHSCAEMATLIT